MKPDSAAPPGRQNDPDRSPAPCGASPFLGPKSRNEYTRKHQTHLLRADVGVLAQNSLSAIANVPVLFDSNWRYLAEPNWYLRDRALLRFAQDRLMTPLDQLKARKRPPTPKTMDSIGQRLGNFLQWLEWRGLCWQDITYTIPVLDSYEEDMSHGPWSAAGEALAPATVSLRLQEARSFLLWTALRGLRTEAHAFDALVPRPRVARPTLPDPAQHFPKRRKARPHPGIFRMPTAAEVERWLSAVRLTKGVTKALACELVIATAIRASELLSWRVDTLPLDPREWRILGDEVIVRIRYGTKGPKRRDAAGDLYGPERSIGIPLELARALHDYRTGLRVEVLLRLQRSDPEGARHRQAEKRLFLSEYTGRPFERECLREAWQGTPHQPFPGWSPHLGRHYWACRTLLQCVISRADAQGLAPAATAPAWVHSNAMDALELKVRPQLGHLQPETTRRYLIWLQHAFTLTAFSRDYVPTLRARPGE